MDPVTFPVPIPKLESAARQAVEDRVKQRILDKFPHGTDTRRVIRADLSIIADPDSMLLVNGSVDTTPAELYEMFNDLIFLRHVQGRVTFFRGIRLMVLS
jgi:hypothetical protein